MTLVLRTKPLAESIFLKQGKLKLDWTDSALAVALLASGESE